MSVEDSFVLYTVHGLLSLEPSEMTGENRFVFYTVHGMLSFEPLAMAGDVS